MIKYEIKYAYTGTMKGVYQFGEGTFDLYGKTTPTEKQAMAGASKLIACKNPAITILSVTPTDEPIK